MKGIGTDILEIERFRHVLKKHGDNFLTKIFTSNEIAYCKKKRDPTPSFAARFSAKEAIAKAFGTGICKDLSFKDIEITNDKFGKPSPSFSEKVNKKFNNPKVLLSISHCDKFTVAFAVLY